MTSRVERLEGQLFEARALVEVLAGALLDVDSDRMRDRARVLLERMRDDGWQGFMAEWRDRQGEN